MMKKLFTRINSLKNVALELFFNHFPIKKNTVIFYSFNGQYNDNPKYISEKLHEIAPDVNIVWGMNKESLGDQPDYVKCIKINSLKFFYYSSTAAVYVDNYTGKHSFRKNVPLKSWHLKLKRKKQLNVSTWHGTPLKKIHSDILATEIVPEGCFTTCDIFACGNEYFSEIVKRNLCDKINVSNVGTPRNDLLFNAKEDLIKEIKEKNGCSSDEKIVIYAPTFRDSIMDSGVTQLELLDVPKLLKAFSNKFGGKWKLVLRTHPGVFTKIKQHYSHLFEKGDVIDGNRFSDMAEYLAISDALITDYSGSLFDFCLTGRPAFLFAHDRKNYSERERGLYMDVSELPFAFADGADELISNIESYSEVESKTKITDFLCKIGNYETGNASADICEKILERLKQDG